VPPSAAKSLEINRETKGHISQLKKGVLEAEPIMIAQRKHERTLA
jgi:hypothetical protein